MELIPAPSRIFKTVSMWIVLTAGMGDLAVGLVAVFADMHIVSTQTLAIVNAVAAFGAGAAKLIHQNIKLTEEQKFDMVEAIQNAPTKEPK